MYVLTFVWKLVYVVDDVSSFADLNKYKTFFFIAICFPTVLFRFMFRPDDDDDDDHHHLRFFLLEASF